MPHRIEIDDEVMALLKERAEPFVDTPNSVLRRLLLLDQGPSTPRESAFAHPSIPLSTPKALEQILEVVYLARGQGITRAAATHAVARKHGVAFQTVLDKYARQLGLAADEFGDMMSEADLARLKRLLNERFGQYSSVIDEVLDPLRPE